MYITGKLLYLDLNFLGAVILLWIRLMLKRDINGQARDITFKRVIMLVISILFLNVLWVCLEGRPGRVWLFCNHIINVLYPMIASVTSLEWCFFVLYIVSPKLFRTNTVFWLLSPALLILLLALSSPWTGALYVISAENVYDHGFLYPLLQAISYFYFLWPPLLFSRKMLKEGQRMQVISRQTLFMVMFTFLGVCFVIFVLNSYDTIWPMFSIILLFVFTDIQFQKISRDGLTGLNNRRSFDSYISMLFSEGRVNESVFLFMMDINFFKTINDTYGHLAGDEALKVLGDILKKTGSIDDQRSYIARYGGDEFVGIYYCADETEAQKILDGINRNVQKFNDGGTLEFPLSISIGFARYSKAHTPTAEQLIKSADLILYENKREMHRLADIAQNSQIKQGRKLFK